jgi:hypothetical protein
MNKPDCIVCTGKTGDILNILPILARLQQQDGKPVPLVVAKAFAPLLSGVSYVKPVVFDGDWMDVGKALEFARQQYKEVAVWQVAGPRQEILTEAYGKAGMKVGDPIAESFVKEQWRVAGAYDQFKNNYPLVFDKRNKAREDRLLKQHAPQDILVHLGGETSPYPAPQVLKQYLGQHWPYLDLDEVKADKIYDLLALYDRAKVLIAIDSAPLHLAQACPHLKVIALTKDKPGLWHGSCWRPNHVMTIRYSQLDRILEIPARVRFELSQHAQDRTQPTIFHVYSNYWTVSQEHAETAQANWKKFYASSRTKTVMRVTVDPMRFGRDSKTVFHGGGHTFPFVKDVIRNATQLADEHDIILLTRPETCLRGWTLKKEIDKNPLFVGARCLLMGDDAREAKVPQLIRDVFVFTAGWWRKHQAEYPDLVMGTEQSWASVMEHFIIKHGGRLLENVCYRKPAPDIEVQPDNYRGYNQHVASQWFTQNNINLAKPVLSKQAQVQVINPTALFPAGYNPSIVETSNGYIMVYRAHRWNNPKTCLAVAVLDKKLNVRNNKWIDPIKPGTSTEDPKLFWHKGKLYCAYVESYWPEDPYSASVHYGLLTETEDQWQFAEHYTPKPQFVQRMEKNWVFFSDGDNIRVIYKQSPEYITFCVDKEAVENVEKAPGMHWKYGEVRGGSQPFAHKGRHYRFFHSTTWHLPSVKPWIYWLGIVQVSPSGKAPYRPTHISKHPVAGGSLETVDLPESEKIAHYKPNVLFPGSLILGKGVGREGCGLCVGVNDVQCAVINVTEDMLKLT